mgnify:CR=1 FL=1
MKKSVKILIVVAVIAITILIGYLGNSLISQRRQVDTRASQDQRQCPADGATCEWDPVVIPYDDDNDGTPTPTKTPTITSTVTPVASRTPSPDLTSSPTTRPVRMTQYRVEVTDLTSGQTILARTTTETKITFTPQVDHEYRCSVSVVMDCGTGDATTATKICRSEPQPSPTLTPTTEASPSATLTPSNTLTPSPTSTITLTPTNTATPTPTVVTCLPPNTCMPQLDCNIGGGNVQNGTCPNNSNGNQQVCCRLPNNSPTPTATPTNTPVPTATFTPVPPTATPAPSSPPPVITQVIVNVTRVVVQNQVVQGNTQVVVITQPPGQPQQPAQPGQPVQPTQPPKQLPNAGGGAWMVILAPIALILAGLAL